jgi:hypothetical protein
MVSGAPGAFDAPNPHGSLSFQNEKRRWVLKPVIGKGWHGKVFDRLHTCLQWE